MNTQKTILIKIVFVLLFLGCQPQANVGLPAYSPIPIETYAPEYPEILRRAGFEGTVEISALVNEEGIVQDVILIKSLPIVDSVCIEAAKKWKFNPGKIAFVDSNYVNYKFWFSITFRWGLSEFGNQN